MTIPIDLFETFANRESVCASCGRDINVRDLIVKEDRTWMHAVCPEVKPRPVCSDCFLEIPLNGECPCES